MERAAKMAAQAEDENPAENLEKKGMKIAASFINNPKADSLLSTIAELEEEEKQEVMGGIAQTLLRNITLPRDGEPSMSSLRSLQVVQELAGSNSACATACAELQQILDQYGQHKEQVQQQLEEALRGQLEQQAMMQGQTGEGATMNPKLHPQYQEELGKMLSDLNDQYTQALTERKEIIKQQLIS